MPKPALIRIAEAEGLHAFGLSRRQAVWAVKLSNTPANASVIQGDVLDRLDLDAAMQGQDLNLRPSGYEPKIKRFQ